MANRCTTIEEAKSRIDDILFEASMMDLLDNPTNYILEGFKSVADAVSPDLYPEVIEHLESYIKENLYQDLNSVAESAKNLFIEGADFDRIRADIEEKARNLSQYEETVVRKLQVTQQVLKRLFGENLYTAQYYLRSAKNGFGLVQRSSDTGIPGLIDTFLANRKNQTLVRNQDIAENVRKTKQALLDKVLEFMRNQERKRNQEQNLGYIDREIFSEENTRLFDRNGEYLNTLDPETDLYNVITSWFNPKNIAMSNSLDTKYTLFKIENNPEAREYIDAYTAWTLLTNFDTTLILTLGNSVLITEPSNFNKISNVSYKTNIDKATNMWSFGFGDDVEDVGDLISDITKQLVESSKRYSWKVNVPNLDSYLSFKDFNYIIGKVKNLAFTLRGKSDIELDYYINGKNIITNENIYNLSGTTRGVYESFKEFNKSIGKKENEPVTLGQLIAFASENPMRSLHAIFDILCNTDILTNRIKSFTDTDKNLLWSCYKEIFGQCGENSRSLFDLHHNTNGDTIFSIIAQLADSMFLEDIIQYYEDDNKTLYAQFMRDYTINLIRNELAQLILQSSSATLSKGAKEFTDAYNVKIEFTNKGQLTTTDKQAWEVGTVKETVPVQAKLIAEIKIPVKITRNGKKIEAGEIIATATNIKFELKNNITEEEIWNSGDFRELIKDATGINFGADPDFAQAYQLMFQGASEINYTALLDDITRIVGRSVFNNYFNTKLVPLILHEFSLTWNQPNINNIAYSLFMNVEPIPRVDPKTGLIPSIPSADKNLVLDKLSQAKAISNNIYTSALVKTGEGTALAAYCLSRLRNSYQYLLVTQNRAAWSASREMTFVDNKNGLFNKVFTSREVKLSATVKPSTKMSSVELWSLNFYNDWVSAFVKKTRTNSPNGDGACCFIPSVNSDKGQYDKLGCNLNALSHITDKKGNPIAYRNLTSDQIVDEICMEFGPFYRNVINNITKEWDRVLSVILSNESLETDASGNKTALTKIYEDAIADINLTSNPIVKWRKLLKFIDGYFSGKKEKTLDGLYRITTKYNMTHTRNPIQLAEQIHYTKGDDGLSVNKVLVALWARFGGAATEEDLKLANFTKSYYRESLDLAKITQLYYRESLDLDLLNLLKKTVSAEDLSKETISAATLSKELFDKIPDDNPLKEEVRAARRASVQSNAKGFFRMRDFESVIKLLKNGCKIYLYGAKAREQAETEFLRNFGKTPKDKKSPWVTDSGMMAFVRVTGEDGREYPTNNFNDLIEAQNSGRKWEVHPLISKLNRMHYLTTQQYTCCVGGAVYAYKGKSGSNVLEEEANRWLASNKRNVCYTATIHKFLNKLLNGSPTTYNYAIFDDIDAALYNVMGELNVHTPLDGGMLVNAFLPDLENASLGGEAAGTDKKHFGTFYLEKYGAGGITKTAGFAATNERMRNSEAWRIVLYNMSHRKWVKEFGNADGDIQETELDINKDYDGNDINWPDKEIFYYRELEDGTINFYKLTSIEKTNNINEYKIYEVPVDEFGEVQVDKSGYKKQPELREITVIDNNWDLFTKVFGGYRSLGREVSSTGVENPNSRLTYSERSRKLMVEAINRIGYRKVSARKYSMIDKLGNKAEAYTKAATREDRHEDDQDDVWLPLKYSDIHFMPNIGAIKSAQINVNPPEVLSQKMDLNVMPVERPKLGIQLDKEHSADDAELSMPTQIITACANKGYTLTKTTEMYRAISTLTELAIEDCMKGIMDLVPGGENRGLLKAQIAQIIVDKLILSKDDNEALHAVLGFLEDKVKAGGKVSPEDVQNIPWSDTLIYNKLYSDIASHLTSQAIKLKLSGSMAVICPTHYLERFCGNKRLAALVDLIPGGVGEKAALVEYQRKIREENYEGGLIYDRTRDLGKSEIELLSQASKINTQHIYHLEYINPLTGEVDPNTKQITINYPMQYYQLRDEIVKFRQASLEELKGALAVTRADGTILVSRLEDIDPEAFYAYINGEAKDAEGKVIVSSDQKRRVFEQLEKSGYTIDSLKKLLGDDPRKILAFLKFHELSHKKYKDNITINTGRNTKQSSQTTQFTWNRTSDNSYEVSSKGDKRFSALYATFKKGTVIDGVDVGDRTIEDVYQSVIKKSRKGQAPAKDSILNLDAIDDNGHPIYDPSRLPKDLLKTASDYATLGGRKLTKEELEDFSYYEGYLPLWQEWARQNPELINELRIKAKGKTLTDQFANTRVSQARALAEILNSTIDNPVPKVSLSTNGYRKGDPQKHPDVNYVFTENAEAYMVSQDTGTADTGTLLPSTWLEALEKFPNKGRTILNVSDVGGTNQAGIRTDNKGNISPNAYGIVVKKYQQDANGRFVAKEGQFQDTDEDFNLFVRLNEDMFRRLSESSNKKIVFPTQIGLGKAALPKRFAEWLQSQLFERFGISSSLEENTRADYDGYGLSLTSVSLRQEKNEISTKPQQEQKVEEQKRYEKAKETHIETLEVLGNDNTAKQEVKDTIKSVVKGISFEDALSSVQSVFNDEEISQIKTALNGKNLHVMSVSRLTDPVFFTKEIIDFLEKNAKKSFTDPTRVNVIEIWSKHDGIPMQDLLRACKKYKVAPMVSFSITGLGDTSLEKGVMKYNDLLDRIEQLIKVGDLNPATTTIRIDPILVGITNMEDIKTIVNRSKELGIKKFVTSLVQSYGYLDGTPRDRKVTSGINKALASEGKTYDWDKYYGRNSQGKINFKPKQQYIDEIGNVLLELNKDPEIEIQTCAFLIKGLKASACLDPLIIERITGVDVTREDGTYDRDTSRPECMCYGAHSDMFRKNEKQCFSSCAYCYAGNSDNPAINYYNEDGTLKNIEFVNTYDTPYKVLSTQEEIPLISNNTESFGVIIDPNLRQNWQSWQKENPTGIVAYRVNFNIYNTPEEAQAGRIGNPFSEGIGQNNRGPHTVQKFFTWLVTGNNFGEAKATEEYRQAIINKILSSPENTPILYYKELGRPSHATILGYLIRHKNLLSKGDILSNAVIEMEARATKEAWDKMIEIEAESTNAQKYLLEISELNAVYEAVCKKEQKEDGTTEIIPLGRELSAYNVRFKTNLDAQSPFDKYDKEIIDLAEAEDLLLESNNDTGIEISTLLNDDLTVNWEQFILNQRLYFEKLPNERFTKGRYDLSTRPEKHGDTDKFTLDHTQRVVESSAYINNLPESLKLSLLYATLLHDIGKPFRNEDHGLDSITVANELFKSFPNEKLVKLAVRYHMVQADSSLETLSDILETVDKYGVDLKQFVDLLLALKTCDIINGRSGSTIDLYTGKTVKETVQSEISTLRKRFSDIISYKENIKKLREFCIYDLDSIRLLFEVINDTKPKKGYKLDEIKGYFKNQLTTLAGIQNYIQSNPLLLNNYALIIKNMLKYIEIKYNDEFNTFKDVHGNYIFSQTLIDGDPTAEFADHPELLNKAIEAYKHAIKLFLRKLLQKDLISLSLDYKGKRNVMIGGKVYNIDGDSVTPIAYELIMPKIYKTIFGLLENDDLQRISADKNFFTRRGISRLKNQIGDDSLYDYQLKRFTGDHMYIFDANHGPIPKGLIPSPNFHLFTEQDGSYSRVDVEGNVIYPLSSKDDEVMMTADGVEVIVTKNPAFFIEKNNSNAITFSNSRVNEERMQDIVDKLKDSTTNNGKRFIRTFTDRNGKIKNFSTLKKRNRMFADLKEDIVESGESTGNADLDRLVAEISQEGLKVHASFLKSLDVIAGRIPALSQLSFMTQKVAAFTNSDINSAYVSVFLLFILGSDLDIDTVNLIGAGFDRLGHYVLWSPYANLGNSELIKASEQLPFPTGLATEITYDNSKDSFFITFNDFFGKNKLFNIELDPNTGDVVRNEQGVYKISFDSESPTAIKQLAEFLNLVEKVGLNLKGNVDQYGNHQYSEELDAEIYAQNLRYRDLGIFTDLHIKPSQLLNVLQQIKEIVDKHNLYIKKVDKRTKEIMAKNLSYCRMFEIAGDPSNLMEAQDSIDNSTKVIKGPEGAVKVTMTEEDKNLVSSNNETKSFPDPVSMVDSLQTNQVGKYDVSVAAKAVQACSMIQYAYDSLLNSDAPEEKKSRLKLPNGGYKIAGKQWTAIANLHDKTYEETGKMQLPGFIEDMLKVLDDETVEKINSAIQNAAMLSVAVDNAKDLSLGKINAGPAMLGMYAYGITLGIDVVTLAKIINSPQGRAISKVLSGNVFTGDMGFSNALQAINFLNGLNLTRFLTQFDYADNRGSKTLFNAFKNIAAKELSIDLNDKCAQEIQERTTKSITKVVEILLRKGKFDSYLNLIQKTSSWGYSEKLLFEALKEYNALIQQWHEDENKQHDLEILSLGAEEIRVLGVLLGSNKGVKTKIEDGINFINTLENIISDRYKIMNPDADESKLASLKIDYLRFCTDKEYMERCIDEYDKVKHTVNILLVVALCPHIFSYLRASIIPHAGFMSASSKYRSTLAVINSGIYNILGIRAAKDKSNSLKGLNNEINAMMLMLWLSDTQKVFYLPSGLRYFKSGTNEPGAYELCVHKGTDPLPISLWTPEGLATFKLYMELCILPKLKNSAFEDNKFVKNLSPFALSLTGTRATVSAYTLTGNLLPKAGTAEEALLREYQAAFEVIKNISFPYKEYKKDTSEGSTIGTYGDALYLYSEYVFGGRKGPNSLMALFELGNNELQKLFRKAKADMDKNRDFKLTIMQKLRSMALMSNIFNPKYSYYYAVNNTDIGVNFYENEEKTLTAKEKDDRVQEAAGLSENYGSIISKRAMAEKEGYENGEEQVQNFLYPELTTPSILKTSIGDVQVTFQNGKITDWNINPKVALDTFKISGDNDSEIIENFNNSDKEEIKNTIAEIDNIVKMINDNIDITYTGVYVDGTVVTEIRNLDIVQTALELAVLKGTGKC